MRKLLNKVAVAALFTAAAGFSTAATANTLDQLLDEVKKNRISEGKLNKQREAEFLSARADKQALLKKAKDDNRREKARGERLKKQYADNEITLANKEVELKNAQGTLGEMFGIVRASSQSILGSVATSIISAEHPGREPVLEKLAAAKEIPQLAELEELWIALQTEMTESGKVSRFDTEVVQLDGSSEQKSVVRIGTFNIASDIGYLVYNDDTKQVQPLGRQPEGYVVGPAIDFSSETSGLHAVYIDPSKGTILNLLKQKATTMERYHQGEQVGYVITVLLVVGLLIAIERLITLGFMGAKMKTQLKNTSNPNANNPLGRLLMVYEENKDADAENLELKLDEAILRETPKVERGINVIKIFAAIAPLLGLLGTVVGMINTFQAITLFGTGDPKIMAGSISMALVTTAMGLIAALPLILVHSIVAARSKSIVHILDEQSAGIIAARVEKESK